MFYAIIAVVVVVVIRFLFPSEFKGTFNWSFKGVRGVYQDAKAIRTKSIERTIENPDLVADTAKYLDTNVADTAKYHKEASARNRDARKSLEAALAKIDAQTQSREDALNS